MHDEFALYNRAVLLQSREFGLKNSPAFTRRTIDSISLEVSVGYAGFGVISVASLITRRRMELSDMTTAWPLRTSPISFQNV